MKKNFSLVITSLLFILSLIIVNPAQAQSSSFKLGSIFTRLKNSVQRLYLKTIPGPKSGQAVIKQSLYQLEKAESFHYEGSLEAKTTDETESAVSTQLTLSGPVKVGNLYQPQNSQQQLTIEGELTAESETSAFAADLINRDQTLYLRLNKLPTELEEAFASLTNQWISLPMKMDSTLETNPETLTEEQQQQLAQATQELLQQAEVSQAQPDSLNGNSVFRVEISFSQEILLSYLQEINQITKQELEIEERQQLEKQLAQITPLNFTFWIGQADFYPRQITTSLKLSDLETSASKHPQLPGLNQAFNPDSLQLQLRVSFSQFNQPVEISAPESAQPINQIFTQIMGFDFTETELPQQLPNQLPTELMPAPAENDAPIMPNMESLEQQQQELLKQYGL